MKPNTLKTIVVSVASAFLLTAYASADVQVQCSCGWKGALHKGDPEGMNAAAKEKTQHVGNDPAKHQATIVNVWNKK